MDLSVLTRHEWRRIWLELPPPSRGAFSNPDYHDVCANWVSAEPECLLLRDGDRSVIYSYLRCPIDQSLTGGLSLFDVQTCYGYGGPIFCGGWTASERRHALRTIGNYLRDTSVVAEFVRCRNEHLNLEDFYAANYEVRRVRTNVEYVFDPGDCGQIPLAWHKNARRYVSRGLRIGLNHTLGSTAADVAEFHRLYNITAARRSMEPFYRFDRAHLEMLTSIDVDRTELVLVRHPSSSACIAGAILFVDTNATYYHLGASDPAFLGLHPNEYLFFAVAQIAASRSSRKVVWGGGRTDDPEDTLFRFKSHFGNRVVPVHVACRVIDQQTFDQVWARWKVHNPTRSYASNYFLKYRQ